MTSLYDQVRELFTPELMHRLEGHFGENSVPLDRAVRAAVSSLVGEVIDNASTEDGATDLLTQVHSADPAVPMGDLRNAIAKGKPLAASLFGARLITARDLITSSSNVSPSTASGVLALSAPLVLAVLSKLHAADATEFGTLLASERARALNAGPASVTALVEDGGFSWRHILPMVLMGLLLAAVPFLYKGCSEAPAPPPAAVKIVMPPMAEVKAETIALPNGGTISVLPGTMNYALSKFLASTEPAPRRFTFDHLNFEFNNTVITPESRPTLADLVTILKAYPAVDAVLEGYTDNVGGAVENKRLSVGRAVAIKSVLQTDGIAARRITTAGFGEEKPVASNDTDEGRAKNRRLELVVVKK